MKLTFDKHAKIAGIGLAPWSRLGLEQWFDAYKIASLYGWDVDGLPGAPDVLALTRSSDELPAAQRWSTQKLLDTPQFQQMLAKKIPGYNVVTYKPAKPPRSFLEAGIRFSSSDQALAQRLENKAKFRALLQGKGIPFPTYRILERRLLEPTAAGLAELLAGREAVVVQDEALSGGKGTFIIRTLHDLQQAHQKLSAISRSTHLVVSDLVAGARERSVQAVVTKYGIFVGPLQKQIVRHPLMVNTDIEGGNQFCGGEISPDDPLQGAYDEIRGYALTIGRHIQGMGYKGIFGIDCLVDAHGNVFVLEINPRITGLTPLLTELYRPEQDIPFYLLHVLELAGVPYTMPDHSVAERPPEGGHLLLHSLVPRPVQLLNTPASGLYNVKTLAFREPAYSLQIVTHSEALADQLLVQQYVQPPFTVSAGGRMLAVYTRTGIVAPDDALLPEIEHAVRGLRENITFRDIE